MDTITQVTGVYDELIAAASTPVAAHAVAVSLVLFVLVYGIVFALGIYYINRLIVRGPEEPDLDKPGIAAPAPPLSVGAVLG